MSILSFNNQSETYKIFFKTYVSSSVYARRGFLLGTRSPAGEGTAARSGLRMYSLARAPGS